MIVRDEAMIANVARILVVPKDVHSHRICTDFSYSAEGEVSINDLLDDFFTKTCFPNLFDLVVRAKKAGSRGFVAACDGKSYYRQFELLWEHRKFFGYKWLGRVIVDGRLPFGISNATQHVQNFSNGLVEIFEAAYLADRPDLWDATLPYIDDFAFFAPTRADADLMVQRFQSCCDVLGVKLGPDKFKPPAPVNKILGFIFDLPNQCVHIPGDKIDKAKQKIRNLLNNSFTRKELESAIGLVQWISQVAFPLKAMLRPLRNLIHHIPHTSRCLLRLSANARKAAHWFLNVVDDLNSCPFDVILGGTALSAKKIFSDASNKGLGFWSTDEYFFSSWSSLPVPWNSFEFADIGAREMLAAVIFMTSAHVNNTNLNFWIDNTTAHWAFWKLDSKNRLVLLLLQVAAKIAIKRGFRWFSRWLSSADNSAADALSRLDINEARRLFATKQIKPRFTEPNWAFLLELCQQEDPAFPHGWL